jgi:hypothetical protein
VVLLFISSGLLPTATATAAQRFGGVEIGAKGIKASAVEVDSGGSAPSLKLMDLDKRTVDVTLSRLKGKRFEAVRIDDVAGVVEDFIKALQSELGVPDANIQVVASSGVPFASNFADLVGAVRKRTGKDVDKIDAREEATLTALVLVTKELRAQALVLDIGSGNTKGGAFLDDTGTPDRFTTLDVPYGTTTLSKAIDAKAGETGASRADVAREVAQQLVGAPLRQQLASHPELGTRNLVLFAGGSVWAFVTVMKPEMSSNPFPEVTAADIKAYADLINGNPGRYPEVDFARVTDATAREAAEADYNRIRGAGGAAPIFKPDELQAGAALLEQVSDALAFSGRKVFFDRRAVTAWITARITPVEYRHLLPGALGRAIPTAPRAEVPQPVPPPAPVIPQPPPPPAPVTRVINEAAAVRAYGAGYELYWSGRYTEALAEFQKAVDSSDGDARFWYYRGLTELALGDYRSAEASIAQGVRLVRQNRPDSRTVGRALERVQGLNRQYLNAIAARVPTAEPLNRGR